ncbi:hypothetical protein SAMN04490182_1957 [Pseudomonas cedrina]|nr:hypothetical protein SAMN04490182_1957 [Pseudomonas cedrina]
MPTIDFNNIRSAPKSKNESFESLRCNFFDTTATRLRALISAVCEVVAVVVVWKLTFRLQVEVSRACRQNISFNWGAKSSSRFQSRSPQPA